MHFDWTILRRAKLRITESLISCGFLGHVSLFYADNVHALLAGSREGVEEHPRISFARICNFANALFLTLIAGNSARRFVRLARHVVVGFGIEAGLRDDDLVARAVR